MNLTPASFAKFDDDLAFLDFVGEHEIAHQQIAEYLARKNVLVPALPVSANVKKDKAWLSDHYNIHLQIAQAIAQTNLPDISAVNFERESEYLDWMQLHSYTHESINASLGINS